MSRRSGHWCGAGLLALAIAVTAAPAAEAHGPVAPIASSYLARVGSVPRGLEAQVIDADQRMWLRVAPHATVVVLDYRGAPYLRFSPAGVDVNHNSAMYYLNQTPAEVPPVNLARTTPAEWHRVSSSHEYSWHDGRLHALASVARLPGVAFVGTWSVPVLLGAQLSAIRGGLWHADDPSLVWLWWIVVLVACVLAAWRLRIAAVDLGVARSLAAGALVGIAVAAIGRELHGRPSVSVWQLLLLAVYAAFVAWAAGRLALRRHSYFFFFIVAVVALWEGVVMLPTLLHGFVLMAVPAFLARVATVICLGCGVGLLFVAFRLADRQRDQSDDLDREDDFELEDERTWGVEI
jgi:hypothetical protein